MRGHFEYILLQPQDIGLAVFYQEDLPAAFSSSCRIHIDDVGRKLTEHLSYCAAFVFGNHLVAYDDIVCFKHREVVSCCICKDCLHLIVQHFVSDLGKEPAVHSEASCQVSNLHPFTRNLKPCICNPLCQPGLVACRAAAAALLGGKFQGEDELRLIVPLLDFAPELATAFDAVHCHIHIYIRPFVPVKNQPGGVVFYMF